MGRNSSALKFGWIAGASKLTPVQSRGGALRADYAVLVKKGARVPAKPHIRAASSHQRPLLPPPRWPPHLTTPILTNHPYLPAICPSHNWKSRARASMQSNRFCKIWGDKYTPQIADRLLRPFIPFVERLTYMETSKLTLTLPIRVTFCQFSESFSLGKFRGRGSEFMLERPF